MTRPKLRFGSARRLPSGKWQARYLDPDGIRRTAAITFDSRADAERWLSKIEDDLRQQRWVDPHEGKTLVGDWALRYMASRVDLKPKTVVTYDNLLRNRILPAFGRRQLARLRPIDVQEWIAGMQGAGLSASHVRQASHLLGGIMKAAVAEGLIAASPCDAVRLPRMRHREIVCFTAAEVERIAEAVRQPYDLAIYLLAYGGLRFGELAALRRDDCDLDRQRLRVDEAVSDLSGQLHYGPPKNHQRRYVTIPPFLCTKLAEHLDNLVERDQRAFVITSPGGQPLRYNNFYRRFWIRALRDAGIAHAGIHSLRHTCASLLIEQGAPIKAVQAQLGHQSAELTLDRYGHLYPDQMVVLAQRLEDARNGALLDDPKA